MWYALAIIILLVIIILSLNVKLTISYTKENKHIITICILFIKIKLYPGKQKKKKDIKGKQETTSEKAKVEKTEETKTENTEKEKIENQSKKTTFTFSKFLKMISFIRYRLTIYDIRITMNVGIDDAANTAILCGGLYAKVYEAIGLLQSIAIVKPPYVQINPAYNVIKFEAEYFISVKIRIFSAIIILFKTYRLLKERKI